MVHTMEDKVDLPSCAVNSNEHGPVIVIAHDEYIFSANDGIRKVWTQIG